jgi:D-alanyl-D-alanine dipeptidase
MWCTRWPRAFLAWFILAMFGTACDERPAAQATEAHAIDTAQSRKAVPPPLADTSELERYLISKQLVNVQELEPEIRVALLYATDQNFLHKVIYKDLSKCYLPCQVAIKLCNAEYFLNRAYPQYHIIVFDAVRPLHIQQQMWDELDMPAWKKINYLANPADISLHNYGAAVDVGIINENDSLLDMGTAFDSFNELSQPKYEARFLEDGSLSQGAYNNRLILRRAMLQAGFSMMHTEWWHFNATNKTTAAARYGLIE